MIKNKIDFAVIFTVKNANPNGDPLNGNRPRDTFEGYGEVSDVCLKRKLRNRFMDMGENVFVQSDDNKNDEYKSLKDRADGEISISTKDKSAYKKAVCEKWIDVRAFGQVFASKDGDEKGVSIGIRGAVSISSAFSVEPIRIDSIQIVKSVNGKTDKKNPDKKDSDTMGTKHRVFHGMYVAHGSVNYNLSEVTGFSDNDAEILKSALISLFENDLSSARPEGSMEVVKVIWWEHNCPSGQYSSAKVQRSLSVKANTENPSSVDDYDIDITQLENLKFTEYDGK